MGNQVLDRYDVVVIGGGAAGLNGALMLGRARRSVVVIDAGEPRNAPADGIHGLLGREGMPPSDLLALGRAEAEQYGADIVSATVTRVQRDNEDFVVELSDTRSVRASRILLTTGLTDELPDIPGLRQRWGRDVIHCPYCHGWEVRDQAIGVLATSPMTVHQALMFRQLSDDVVVFLNGTQLPAEQAEQLAARGITTVPDLVAGVEVVDDAISGVRLHDGTVIKRQVVVVATRMVARANFLDALGLQPQEHPSGMGEFIPTDAMGRTEVPDVWAAGNVTDLMAQVGASAAAGAAAAAQINADLVHSDTLAAVAQYRR
ncbi:NAD(P)/FAD-dependent oxidoreductase [Hoyosella rhizosphaerae]|uniref:Thioredoxin reductase n=1 Tax=Hoyosella rhizosphaerae TaxID=1755582 RepID=A0A916U1L1_9ACTN|nr:NAD(P)/FAD-dependent oxidoreductase [Hoyosella rhizosphaerae]MBN4927017.1 NAD(P)/FAD-dependent oxidoreductase [Hoyosella rhizosphaerae]GGC54702.1 thioredoxin reductase [Hoyosella rhizosphaerae]